MRWRIGRRQSHASNWRPVGLRLLVLIGVVALATACSQRAQAQEVFIDELSGFTVTTPGGWYMQSGKVLSERTQEEARRFKDPQLTTPPGRTLGGPDAHHPLCAWPSPWTEPHNRHLTVRLAAIAAGHKCR
jgi:hypothetical protein